MIQDAANDNASECADDPLAEIRSTFRRGDSQALLKRLCPLSALHRKSLSQLLADCEQEHRITNADRKQRSRQRAEMRRTGAQGTAKVTLEMGHLVQRRFLDRVHDCQCGHRQEQLMKQLAEESSMDMDQLLEVLLGAKPYDGPLSVAVNIAHRGVTKVQTGFKCECGAMKWTPNGKWRTTGPL